MDRHLWIEVDTGGTFTDLVSFESGSATFGYLKVATSSDGPSRAILEGVSLLLAEAEASSAAFALFLASSSADLGHDLPGDVWPHNHLHLFGDMIVSSSWLVGIGIVATIAIAMVVKRIGARTAK